MLALASCVSDQQSEIPCKKRLPRLQLAVPSHVAVGPAAKDKEKEKEKDRERAAALAAKAQLAAHGQIRCSTTHVMRSAAAVVAGTEVEGAMCRAPDSVRSLRVGLPSHCCVPMINYMVQAGRGREEGHQPAQWQRWRLPPRIGLSYSPRYIDAAADASA